VNPWLKIPLKDYEKHMNHPLVGQLELLSNLTKEKLQKYKPESIAILGVCGGNGLEHINNSVTKTVIGIDINQEYLDECKNRYSTQITNLKLFQCDLNTHELPDFKAYLVMASLIFEYIDINTGLEKVYNCISENGILIAIIQKNNNVTSVSPTGVESVKEIGSVFKILDEFEFEKIAKEKGFKLISKTEHFLVNGKSFVCLDFQK